MSIHSDDESPSEDNCVHTPEDDIHIAGCVLHGNQKGQPIEFNKPVKDISRSDLQQNLKTAWDFHVKNRALETLVPEQGKRIQAGAKFSQTTAYQNLFQALPFERVKDDFSTLNNFRWGAILQATLKGSGVSPIDMKTSEGRQRFKKFTFCMYSFRHINYSVI